MQIVIELGDEVGVAAERRIREAVEATEQHDIDFQGCQLVVRRGDFTCIAEGGGHRSAQRLFNFVGGLVHSGEFGVDPSGMRLIPIACGGFVEVSPKKRDETAKDRKARERREKRAAGLVPIEVWVYPEGKAAIRALEAELTRGRT